MVNKKACLFLLTSLIITSLFGCGSGGGTANLQASTSGNGAQLEAISITPTNPTIAVNTDIQFTATGIYSDNTTQDLTSTVTWTSSSVDDPNVASGPDVARFSGFTSSSAAYSSSYYKPGYTQATCTGKAKIWGKWGNISGSTTVTVTSATLVSIAITPTNPTIVKNTNQQFVATGTFSDNTTQDLTATVTWSSSTASVAAISNSSGSNGLATSEAAGSTTITATSGNIAGSTLLTVTPATLVSIAVNPTNPSMATQTTKQFTASGTYSDNTTQDLTASVTWSSSTSAVAAISNTAGSNGLATSAAAGSTTITATSGGISGSIILTVTPTTLVSISITPSNPSFIKGTTTQFSATGTYSDNTTQDLTTGVTWKSSSTAVAAISNAAGSNGLTTSVAAGSSTITATLGSVSGSATLTVTPATLVSIAVTPTNTSFALGTSKQFTATGTYSDNTTQNLTTSVTWKSSAATIAAISNAAGSNGLATSVAAGSSTITATSGSVVGTATLTVTSATLVSIAVTPTNSSIVKGTTKQFTATGTYSDNSTQNLTTAVSWSSSIATVAAISNAAGSNGKATSIATGSTTITATSGGVSGTATLTVTAATLVSLAITPANPTIAQGASQQFTATGTYSDSSTQNLTTSVTWNSSTASVASISNAVGSNGLATAVAAGSTTITATSGSVSGSATLTVTGASVVTLGWNAPTTNTDGSALNPATDISQYKIYYGTASLTYSQVVSVANPGTSTISKTLNLAPGTYYFSVTTVDTSGDESSYSNEVMKTL
jgi:trimeric autotransporter adhesin